MVTAMLAKAQKAKRKPMERKQSPNGKPAPPTCPLHPSMITRQVCKKCGRPMCVHCAALSIKARFCPSCAKEPDRPRSTIWHDDRFKVSLLAAGILVVLFAFIYPYQTGSPEPFAQQEKTTSNGLLFRRPVPDHSPAVMIVRQADFDQIFPTLKVEYEPMGKEHSSLWDESPKNPETGQKKPQELVQKTDGVTSRGTQLSSSEKKKKAAKLKN